METHEEEQMIQNIKVFGIYLVVEFIEHILGVGFPINGKVLTKLHQMFMVGV
jgi:hypothetical protein